MHLHLTVRHGVYLSDVVRKFFNFGDYMARMEIDKAIELISVNDPFWISRQRCLALQAIRDYIKDVKKSSHNSPMLKCPHCGEKVSIVVTSA